MFSFVGSLLSGVTGIVNNILGGRTAKSLAKRSYRLQSGLLSQEFSQNKELIKEQKEATLEVIGAQKSQTTPLSLQNASAGTSFFGLENIESSNWFIYLLIGLGVILLFTFFKKKRK